MTQYDTLNVKLSSFSYNFRTITKNWIVFNEKYT